MKERILEKVLEVFGWVACRVAFAFAAAAIGINLLLRDSPTWPRKFEEAIRNNTPK